MVTCLKHTELPNTSKLFADFVYHHDRVAAFYEGSPLDPESYAAAAARLDYSDSRRAAMAAALAEMNGPSPELDLFARPGTVAVVTGQQVGLFSGPCYTIYKALTAARLTADLNARGIPAVTVFWLASEDHDFAEVSHAWSFGADGQPASQSVAAPDAEPRPVGEVSIPDYPVAALRALLADLPFGDEVAAMVEESYTPGATMGGAFHALLRRLMPKLGLLYLCPMQPSVRAIAAPLIRDAVNAAPLLAERLQARGKELEQMGYHAQVHFEAKNSLFFLLEDGRRYTMRRDGAGYAYAGGRISSSELAARAEHISPNALLRPVAQDYMLPTAAQIGGPAEIAYLAQTQVLYSALGRRGPVVTPRSGFTLLDSRCAKLMSRYGLSIPAFYDGFEPLRDRISASLVPPRLQAAIAGAHSSTEKALDGLRAELASFDATLAAALDKSRAKMLYQLAKVDKKTRAESMRRDDRAQKEAAYLYGRIFPEKHLQERLYTILPFLAAHGLDLVDRLYEHVRLECPDHLVAQIGI